MSYFGGLGGFILLVRRSLTQHALSTLVTVISVALASGLVMSVFSIKTQTYNAFTGGPVGFDAVLGARGSQLQLVLNTVFHLETSPGNIPWMMYQTIQKDPNVELAVPYAVGDNYRGFRIVGVTDKIFSDFEYQKGRRFQVKPGGQFFNPERREAVIGSFVAQKTGLDVGSKFNPYHGLIFDEKMRHAEEYEVVGVLEPTNSPSDRLIWVPIEWFYRTTGHVLRGKGEIYEPEPGEEIPDEHKEVSAVMLKLKNPQSGFILDQIINKQGKVATLAWPIGRVMAELFDKIGWVNRILSVVAYLVVFIAAGSILASIYNTINERRREFAILRALGARKKHRFLYDCPGGSLHCGTGVGMWICRLCGYPERSGYRRKSPDRCGVGRFRVSSRTPIDTCGNDYSWGSCRTNPRVKGLFNRCGHESRPDLVKLLV